LAIKEEYKGNILLLERIFRKKKEKSCNKVHIIPMKILLRIKIQYNWGVKGKGT